MKGTVLKRLFKGLRPAASLSLDLASISSKDTEKVKSGVLLHLGKKVSFENANRIVSHCGQTWL